LINKKNHYFKAILVIHLSFYLFFIPFANFIKVNINETKRDKNVRISGPISPIIIDDTLPGSNWAWASTQPWFGGGSGLESDPYVLKSLIIDGGGVSDCITIKNSIAYFKIQNCTVYNSGVGAGIYLNNVSNGILFLNNCSNTPYYGIDLYDSCYNHIESNFIIGYSGGSGINLWLSHNNTIGSNFIKYKYQGIRLETSSDNLIVDNTAELNENFGILLMTTSNHNTVSGNNANNQTYESGITVLNSQDNTITDNFLSDNNKVGIEIDASSFNELYSNTIISNEQSGISIWTNLGSGISTDNNVTGNIISENGNGIYLSNTSNNQILNNEIANSDQIGIAIALQSNYTIISSNLFYANGNHAFDHGVNNDWNGNYWDNYSASDSDNDGIGDVPHLIPGTAGSADFLPIWDERAPIVEISIPEDNLFFGRDAPEFLIHVYDPYLDKMWYTVDGGLTNITFFTNGTIDQHRWESLWDGLGQGDIITLIFYANDTFGHLGFDSVELKKEIPINDYGIDSMLIIILILLSIGISIILIISIIYYRKRKLKS
jgi:parallel beta-helix repeat protein